MRIGTPFGSVEFGGIECGTGVRTGSSKQVIGWRTLQRDEENTGVMQTSGVSRPVSEKWSFDTGGAVYSSANFVDGTIYVSGNGRLYALNAEDGSKKWEYLLYKYAAMNVSPTTVDGTVYIGSDNSRFYALDAEDGSEKWVTSLGGGAGYDTVVQDGVVYAGRRDVYQGPDPRVFALDTSDGSIIWESDETGEPSGGFAYANGMVYAGCEDTKIYALDASDGSKVWEFTTGSFVRGAPTVVDDIAYCPSGDGSVYALDASDGSKLWDFQAGADIQASPVIVDGTVYVGSFDDKVYAIE